MELPNHIGGASEQENVVAEIRGREKPEEFVVLARTSTRGNCGTGALDDGCNAALVVEAARDIHLTACARGARFASCCFQVKNRGCSALGLTFVRIARRWITQ